ncbi:hypothetical protein D9M68_999430 [compost metagenome]
MITYDLANDPANRFLMLGVGVAVQQGDGIASGAGIRSLPHEDLDLCLIQRRTHRAAT